jgi:phosphate transport system substrate-binding protein
MGETQMHFSSSIGSSALTRLSMFLLAAVGLTAVEGALAQEVVRISGTGTGTLLIQRLIEPYAKANPGMQVNAILPPMGSNGAMRALAGGAIQIAVVSFPSVLPARAEDAGTINSISWVRTPFVFTGREVVAETKLTLGQVSDIYSGRITQWPDGKQIRVITRTERETDTRVLRGISPQMDEAVSLGLKRTGMPFAENDIDNQKLLERTPGSFGAIGLGQILLEQSPLKPAILDGVFPSPESLRSGAYRIEKPLYLILTKTPSAATLDFVRYLQSPDAIKIAGLYGFIPVRR